MKLNLVKDYQTGIYDYNDMLSTFVSLAPVNQRLAARSRKHRSPARSGVDMCTASFSSEKRMLADAA